MTETTNRQHNVTAWCEWDVNLPDWLVSHHKYHVAPTAVSSREQHCLLCCLNEYIMYNVYIFLSNPSAERRYLSEYGWAESSSRVLVRQNTLQGTAITARSGSGILPFKPCKWTDKMLRDWHGLEHKLFLQPSPSSRFLWFITDVFGTLQHSLR